MKKNRYWKLTIVIVLFMSVLISVVLARWWFSERIALRLMYESTRGPGEGVCVLPNEDHGRFGLSGIAGDLQWMPGWHYSFGVGIPMNEPFRGCTVFVPLIGKAIVIKPWGKEIQN